jgi:hypothetical protein
MLSNKTTRRRAYALTLSQNLTGSDQNTTTMTNEHKAQLHDGQRHATRHIGNLTDEVK